MLSRLTSLIPGSTSWPRFVKNKSEQFESRVCMVKIKPSKCIFFQGMQNSIIPIVVAHGEGRTVYKNTRAIGKACLNFKLCYGNDATDEDYPLNPNGSVAGECGFSSDDGRVLIMMPHPERVVRRVTNTWLHSEVLKDGEEFGPWMEMFYNARRWVETVAER